MADPREQLSSRLGFLLISAGCAIGLGNVWRFPFITGQYGGGAFVLIYLLCLLVFGLPLLVMEFAIGRAAQKNIQSAYAVLAPQRTGFQKVGYIQIAANWLLMMFYTTISGWMLAYFWFTVTGKLTGPDAAAPGTFFQSFTQNAPMLLFWMTLTVVAGFAVCALGLRKGVERFTKYMMAALLLILVGLAVHCAMLPNAREGLSFYLIPDFSRVAEHGIFKTVFAALGQSFFTLGLGVGSMTIFGSYIGKQRSLTGESVRIIAIDTFVALTAGVVIFSACSTFNVDSGTGPGLVFVTLPSVFGAMPAGRFWGALFFLFLALAAMTTVIAVFEHLMAYAIDRHGWSRKKAALINGAAMWALSLPCTLGFNVLSGIHPLGGSSTFLDLEDLLVSGFCLPVGALTILLFCTCRRAWGWKNFLREANTGKGIAFPAFARIYVTWLLPVLVLILFIVNLVQMVLPLLKGSLA